MLVLFGGNAMSAFRIEALIHDCRKLSPGLKQLTARYLYFIHGDLSADSRGRLSTLLDAGVEQGFQSEFIVIPRPGTISPWASKATDIAHNCGLTDVLRVERGIGWMVDGELSRQARTVFFDRMTETVIEDHQQAQRLFNTEAPSSLKAVDVLQGGVEQLRRDNQLYGFALSDDEMVYLVENFQQIGRNPTDAELMMFAQANSEHCRHKIFNASWNVDGVDADSSLFGMIRETHQAQPAGTLIAYDDNAAVIEGFSGNRFMANPETGIYFTTNEAVNIQIKVETHNHPTAISPFAGAATGSGGEIRDEGATGNGAKPKAGLCGFSVSNLRIPGFTHAWEQHPGKPEHIASAFQIMQEGPIGAASFNNEFGRPNLGGYFRTWEGLVKTKDGEQWRGYHKPIMIAGGLGNIRPGNTHKRPVPAGSAIVVLGGPAMLIGLGGGAASSLASGQSDSALDYASVQRGNPEMQRRCQEVINLCVAMGEDSPILSMHDVGAGGLSNALPELVNDAGRGAHFELRDILVDEPGMSPMEIWCNESQERYVLAVAKDKLDLLTGLCERERCPLATVGYATEEKQLLVTDRLLGSPPVNMSLQTLLGKPPKMERVSNRKSNSNVPLEINETNLTATLYKVIQVPCVASKNFLITIGDRTVGGLVHQDQMVGPHQMPVADCAVTLSDFTGFGGEAMSMGERSPLALISPEASGRVAIAEALTNLVGTPVGDIKNVKLSANWMAAANVDDAALFDVVTCVTRDFCIPLGLSIPVGKDSLSMQSRWRQNDTELTMTAPLSLVVSAFAPVKDVTKTVTPQLVNKPDTVLLLADFGDGKDRLGASVLAQVYQQVGNECPDVDDVGRLASLFSAVQESIEQQLVLACHDKSDGGLIVSIAEMCFAGHCGADLTLQSGANGSLGALFNEEIGLVLQVERENLEAVREIFVRHGAARQLTEIGSASRNLQLTVQIDGQSALDVSVIDLKRQWWETSYQMQKQRDNPDCAEQELQLISDSSDPGIRSVVTFDPSDSSIIATGEKPKLAVLREQGVNGYVEMAAAFYQAGFECIDVHMSDIISGRVSLASFNGLVACGGFSYGDVLGAGGGWASSIRYNSRASDQFEQFFGRSDVFALGVCNGCQMMAKLRDLIPGASHWPDFNRNLSEQFEARVCTVQIESSPSILFSGMEGSRIPVAVAHGEGRVDYGATENSAHGHVTLRYVDNHGDITEHYPLNPNGSANGITGLCSDDGRFNIMMPHPERVYRSVQNSYQPVGWSEDGPWLKMFRNACQWVSQA